MRSATTQRCNRVVYWRHVALFLFVFLLPSSATAFDFDYFCPGGQYDLGYIIQGIVDSIRGTVGRWLEPLEDGETSLRGPGVCDIAHITYPKVKEELELMVQKLDDGTAYRTNNLGIFRFNTLPFACNKRTTVYSDGYCGIGLGAPHQDHVAVRPYFDHAMGAATDPGSANRWSPEDLLASAQTFLEGRDELPENSVSIWVVKEVHLIVHEIVLTDEEAKEFSDMLTPFFITAFLPSIISGLDFFGVRRRLQYRKKMTDRYEAAIRELIAMGDADLVDENNNVEIAAQVSFDTFMFAAIPAVSSVFGRFMDSYVMELTPRFFPDDADLGAAILETIRMFPPVLSAPYVKKETNKRQLPLVGTAGLDESFFGPDALEFRVRLTEAEYQATTLSWANAAVGIPGRPGTSHVCPAKSLSFNMIKAFLKAMDPSMWTTEAAIPISRATVSSVQTRPSNGRSDVVWKRKKQE